MKDFEKECNDWLNPLDYYIHSFNPQRTWIMYSHNDIFGNYPAIECAIDENGNKSCELMGGNKYKYFIRTISGKLSFKHKDIENYIKYFKYYEDLAERYPPF